MKTATLAAVPVLTIARAEPNEQARFGSWILLSHFVDPTTEQMRAQVVHCEVIQAAEPIDVAEALGKLQKAMLASTTDSIAYLRGVGALQAIADTEPAPSPEDIKGDLEDHDALETARMTAEGGPDPAPPSR